MKSKTFRERLSNIPSVDQYAIIPCNKNGMRNFSMVVVNNDADLIAPDMYHLAIDDYMCYVDHTTGMLVPEYGQRLFEARALFDTIGEHSKNRVYFAAVDSVNSNFIFSPAPDAEPTLNNLLDRVSTNSLNLLSLKFWFKYFVYVSADGFDDIALRYDFSAKATLIYRANLTDGYLEELINIIPDSDYQTLMMYLITRAAKIRKVV